MKQQSAILEATMEHVYAIIRYDEFLSDFDIESKITVKKVVRNIERAKSEVDRLNKVNAARKCRYFWQLTRLEDEHKHGEGG